MKTPLTVSSHFAVLGSPIGHSKSPLLHRAAIAALGIDADYSAFEVNESYFQQFVTSRGLEDVGFSLTMPLKHVARSVVTSECRTSALTGAINTIVRAPDGWHGFNTDVWGAQTAIAQSLGTHFASAALLGAGATASSLVVALHGLGVRQLAVLARDESRAQSVVELARHLGMSTKFSELGSESVQADLLVNTLPGSVQLDTVTIDDLDAGALFDVVYDPWPTHLSREWTARGLPSSNGLTMLLWQAVRQARVFYGDGVDEELPNESLVVTAMRSAVGL
ncbi:MAG: hypothetical protein RLZZ587_990 [Actinomycetota bacterium]|jgi:shikimate dehydrogenase